MSGLENSAEKAAEFVTISELAAHLGVTIGPVSRRVTRLEADGLLTTRTAGAKKLVPLAAYMATVGKSGDEVRAANGRRARGGGVSVAAPVKGEDGPSLSGEQARKTRIQADLAQAQLDQLLGRLVDAVGVADALATAGGIIARRTDSVVTMAAEWAAIVGRDGEQGLRRELKEWARETRERQAAALTSAVKGGVED